MKIAPSITHVIQETTKSPSTDPVAKSPADIRKLMEKTILEEEERKRKESHQLPLKSILKKPTAATENPDIAPVIERVIERNTIIERAPVEEEP